MNDFHDIKRLLMPLLKGSPFILLCLIISLMICKKALEYAIPMYESTAILKLDDSNVGVGNTQLFKDFDLFSTTNKIATEVEVLKSKELIKKAIEGLSLDASYTRVGRLKKTELYHNSPFKVSGEFKESKLYNRPIKLNILSEDSLNIEYEWKEKIYTESAIFGDTIDNVHLQVVIELEDELIKSKTELDVLGEYEFRLHTENQLASAIKGNLDIKAKDKDVPVIRISYKSVVPEKTMEVTNALAESYINDFVLNKTQAAGKTVRFIDDRLDDISRQLKKSEKSIEDYKLNNGVVNLRQETETGLRKIAQLEVQLSNLVMNESALDALDKYIESADSTAYLDLSPQFGYGDLLFTELSKKLKAYQAERKELLLKYTPNHEEVMIVDQNIAELVDYIKRGIKNAKKDISIKRREVELSIQESEAVFVDLPSKEKDLMILEREFQLNQKTFNFLMEKRMEAAIASAASISFHRVLEKAELPKQPVSPNRTLLLFVSGLIGLMIGVALVYIFTFIRPKLGGRRELEKQSETPLLGVVKKGKRKALTLNDSIATLANQLGLVNKLKKHQAIVVSSAIKGEGKTYIAAQLAQSLAAVGWKVGILDANLRKADLHQQFQLNNDKGLAEYLEDNATLSSIIQSTKIPNLSLISAGNSTTNPTLLFSHQALKSKIKALKKEFDLLIIDTPATAIATDAINLMKMSEHNIYVLRSNYTPTEFLLQSDLIKEEYGIQDIRLILNGVNKNTSYNGLYQGRALNYQKKSWWRKLLPKRSKQKPSKALPTQTRILQQPR